MSKCDRCREEVYCMTMSYFNTDMICLACEEAERAHPEFARAVEVEREHTKAGDLNFRGVGLPANLKVAV